MTEKHSNNDYNKNLKEFARNLRNNSTFAEVILWDKVLKRRQLRDYSFLRQRPIDKYIADFFCKELKLIIELDGKIHQFQKYKDKKREEVLQNLGFTIIRFHNKEILNNLYNVRITLEHLIDDFETKKS